jgi:chromosome partitioning protein
MAKVIAFAQQKGGVGKTTSTINLGAALMERGRRVLLVDLDPQGALSAGLGLNPLGLERTVYNVLRQSSLGLADVVQTTEDGFDVVPANIDLAAAELELVSEPGREYFLKEKLGPLQGEYDYVLIDCQPSLGLLTLNALSAAERTILPVQTEYFALRGMDLLFDTIRKVQARINPQLRVIGILPTMYDSRTLHAREVLDELRRTYPELLLKTVVPKTVKLPDSTVAGQSILKFQPASPAAEAYRELAKEVEASE